MLGQLQAQEKKPGNLIYGLVLTALLQVHFEQDERSRSSVSACTDSPGVSDSVIHRRQTGEYRRHFYSKIIENGTVYWDY